MSYRNQREEETLFVGKQKVLPDDEGRRTSQRARLHPDLLLDNFEKTGIRSAESAGKNCSKANHLEVRCLGDLTVLKKQPLENYFGGTKAKKLVEKKVKKKGSQSLHEFIQNEPHTHLNVGENAPIPRMKFTKKEETLTEEEKIESKKLQYQIYKNLKMLDYSERQIYIQQRLLEENYIHQQEKLADTWIKYLQDRDQLRESSAKDELSHPKPLVVARKFSKEDRGGISSRRKLEKEENCGWTQKMLSFDELTGDFCEKLLFDNDD